ncbi:MAG TPA: hypothetical protein VFY12_06680, partial [Arenimonas sp.]|nr:hypothetical protein [Arenimonas sp.]
MALKPLAWLRQKFSTPAVVPPPAAPVAPPPSWSIPVAAPEEEVVTFAAGAVATEAQPVAVERRIKPRTNAREGTRALIIDDSPTIVA